MQRLVLVLLPGDDVQRVHGLTARLTPRARSCHRRIVRPELEAAIRPCISRALERLAVDPYEDPQTAAREIRERFLEWWENFRHLGVEARGDLDGLVVRIRRRAHRTEGESFDVEVDVRRTPLARFN